MPLSCNPVTVHICYAMASFDGLHVLRYFRISKKQTFTKLESTTIFQEAIERGNIGLVHYTVNNIHIWQYRVIDGSHTGPIFIKI